MSDGFFFLKERALNEVHSQVRSVNFISSLTLFIFIFSDFIFSVGGVTDVYDHVISDFCFRIPAVSVSVVSVCEGFFLDTAALQLPALTARADVVHLGMGLVVTSCG